MGFLQNRGSKDNKMGWSTTEKFLKVGKFSMQNTNWGYFQQKFKKKKKINILQNFYQKRGHLVRDC